MPAAGELARMSFHLVVAATKNGMGIGKSGTMPWNLPGDMAYFKELTSKTRDPSRHNAVIMGRKTWDSIPARFRPLQGRYNVVLTRSPPSDENSAPRINASTAAPSAAPPPSPADGVLYSRSLDEALALLGSERMARHVETVFVIGGGQVYRDALASPACAAIHLTAIEAEFECDTSFPAIDPKRFRLWSASAPQTDRASGVRYAFLCYTAVDPPGTSGGKGAGAAAQPQLPPGVRSRHEECQYLDLVRELIEEGVFRPDRTGTGTLSKFGTQMRFNLRHTLPLLTTKRVFWRGVVEELLWFVKGSTNANELRDRGVHIWDGNSSRAFLDSRGLTHREEGDLGPVYGFQWRHFGAPYTDMHADYTGQGVDQLAAVVAALRSDPTDRRIIMSAWNPAALSDMALPPCHLLCQFYVAHGELSCHMYQRSADVGLGVPFNIASYALLTCMLAQVTGLQRGELVHTLGDAHVYANHVEPLRRQLLNAPRHLPVLRITREVGEIDAFTATDFELVGYQPHAKIEMQMAV